MRAKYRVPADAFVVLHVGHLNRRRGVGNLAALAPMAYPILVGSTSTPQDEALAAELTAAGVRVLTEYLPHVAEMYQLADVYLFPTPPNPLEPSSIDLPLSVLEALACDLPALSTRFGALAEHWPSEPGIVFYADQAGLIAGLERLRRDRSGTRHLALALSWQRAAAEIVAALTPGA